MLPENVKWEAVFQSIVDIWLPLIGMVAAIVVIAIIVHVLGKKDNDFVSAYPSGFLNKPGLFERRQSVIWK
mgnify:FL=1